MCPTNTLINDDMAILGMTREELIPSFTSSYRSRAFQDCKLLVQDSDNGVRRQGLVLGSIIRLLIHMVACPMRPLTFNVEDGDSFHAHIVPL